MTEVSIGSVLAGYRIEGVAGEGGMGRVYRATQIGLDRRVALKLIMPELANQADFRARFQRESHLSASIDHPNVIPVYEAGEAEGRLFIAMRWVEGTDLRSVIVDEGVLDPARVVAIVEQVAAALDAAHSGGLVHRDVKPANVMLTATHGQEHVYLMDFGLTKKVASNTAITRTGAFVGTPDYMAPEQIKGEWTDARADVYALGCLLFQALTGRPPYDRDSEVAKMYAQLHDPPPRAGDVVPGTPAGLDAVISRALAKDADERYPSAGDLGRAARAALTGAAPSQPERSLATGLAAPHPPTAPSPREPDLTAPSPPPPGVTTPSPPPDRTAPSPPPASPPPGAAAPSPPPQAPPPLRAGTPAPPPSPPPPAQAPRRALPIVLAALVLLAIAAGVLAASGVLSGDEDPPGGFSDSAREAQDPSTSPRVVATIPAGDGPDGIAVDGETVWVSNARANAMVRIDAADNERFGRPVAAGTNPDEVEAEDGVAWVSNTGDGTITRVEGDNSRTVSVGAGPEGLSLGQQLVWVANGDSDSVSRIDRGPQATVLEPAIAVENKPIGIYVGEETVWVTNSFSGTVTRIDTATGELLGTTERIAPNIRSVIEAFGFVWVTSAVDGGTVTRLNRETGAIVGRPIPLGDRPKEMAVAAGFLWVVNERSNNVMRIDPKRARVVGSPIRVGRLPVGIAAGAGSLWVSNNGSDNVTRIDPGG